MTRRISAPFTLEERQALSRWQAAVPFLCPDTEQSYHRETPFRQKGALAVTADGLICSDCGYRRKTVEIADDREPTQVGTERSGPAGGAGPR